MADVQFLRLNDKWALAYDSRQWVVQRRSGVRKSGDYAGEEFWRALSFIGTSKAVLLRVLREKGIEPTAVAQRALDALPDTFREFHEQQAGTQGTGDREKSGARREIGLRGVQVPERGEIAPSATLNTEAA